MPLDSAVRGRWSVLEYLGRPANSRKVLIVGCGTTPQHVTMGSGAMTIPGIACSLGRAHSRDFTLDVSADAGADLVIDLVTFHGTELGQYGYGRFDQVDFEYLNRGPAQPFSDQHIRLWIDAADKLLKPGGKIVFYSGSTQYRNVAKSRMVELGYRCAEEALKPDGTPGNKYGHIFCYGVKKGR